MALLLLLGGLWLSTEDTLHNDVPKIRCGSITIYGIIISGIITCIIIILHIRRTNVASVRSNVRLLARTIPLHVTKPMVVVALNARSVNTRRCHRIWFLGGYLQNRFTCGRSGRRRSRGRWRSQRCARHRLWHGGGAKGTPGSML
jgi:hypothetical protein